MLWPATSPHGRTSITVSVRSRPGDQDTAARQIRDITGFGDHALCSAREH